MQRGRKIDVPEGTYFKFRVDSYIGLEDIKEKQEGTTYPSPRRVRVKCHHLLTLARRNRFLHTPRPRGMTYTPLAVSPLIELELPGKKRACRPLREAALGIPTEYPALKSEVNR